MNLNLSKNNLASGSGRSPRKSLSILEFELSSLERDEKLNAGDLLNQRFNLTKSGGRSQPRLPRMSDSQTQSPNSTINKEESCSRSRVGSLSRLGRRSRLGSHQEPLQVIYATTKLKNLELVEEQAKVSVNQLRHLSNHLDSDELFSEAECSNIPTEEPDVPQSDESNIPETHQSQSSNFLQSRTSYSASPPRESITLVPELPGPMNNTSISFNDLLVKEQSDPSCSQPELFDPSILSKLKLKPKAEDTKSILLVDDVFSILLHYKRFLQKALPTAEIQVAMNGVQALEKMKSQVFSVVFMDLGMPVMGGKDCVTELRKWERETGQKFTQNVVALYNSNDIQKDREELQSIGFNGADTKEDCREQVFMRHLVLSRIVEMSSPKDSESGSEVDSEGSSAGKCLDMEIFGRSLEIEGFENLDTSGVAQSVLVVDDCKAIRTLYERRLSKIGLKVYLAENGKEGLEIMKKMHFLMVFMDINMPVMGGKEAVQLLREFEKKEGIHPPQHVLAIFSTDGVQDRTNELKEFGFNDAEEKSTDKDFLEQVMARQSITPKSLN